MSHYPTFASEIERMSHPVGASPAVVRFVEQKFGRRVISVEKVLDADGCCFGLADGDFVMVAATTMEHIEREAKYQIEEMMMAREDVLSRTEKFRFKHPSHSQDSVEHVDGTMQARYGKSFDMCAMDEPGELPKFGVEKFFESLRKVYWYRYLKNKLKK